MIFLLSACGNSANQKPHVLTDSACAAIKYEAQDHLIDLLTVIKINGAGNKTFRYLVKYSDNKAAQNQEVWGKVFAVQNDSLKCIVAKPLSNKSAVKVGDTVMVSQGQVNDWIMNDLGRGNNFGDYTGAYLKAKTQ